MKKVLWAICSLDDWELLLNLASFLAHYVLTGFSIFWVNELEFEAVSDGWNVPVRLQICIKIEQRKFDLMSSKRK